MLFPLPFPFTNHRSVPSDPRPPRRSQGRLLRQFDYSKETEFFHEVNLPIDRSQINRVLETGIPSGEPVREQHFQGAIFHTVRRGRRSMRLGKTMALPTYQRSREVLRCKNTWTVLQTTSELEFVALLIEGREQDASEEMRCLARSKTRSWWRPRCSRRRER